MTKGEMRHGVLAQGMAALVTVAVLALASLARAEGGPAPVVLSDKSALPGGCVSLGEVSAERFMATSPQPERVQADAVVEAREKGATHLVTESLEHCGPYSYCYTGVAYRCPAPGGTSTGK
jgi:hypothetical protein